MFSSNACYSWIRPPSRSWFPFQLSSSGSFYFPGTASLEKGYVSYLLHILTSRPCLHPLASSPLAPLMPIALDFLPNLIFNNPILQPLPAILQIIQTLPLAPFLKPLHALLSLLSIVIITALNKFSASNSSSSLLTWKSLILLQPSSPLTLNLYQKIWIQLEENIKWSCLVTC